MATKSIQEKLQKEQEKLATLEEKRKDIDDKIKVCKANITKLEMTINNAQMGDILAALKEKGLTVDQMVAAINEGNLLTLQESMENAQKGE